MNKVCISLWNDHEYEYFLQNFENILKYVKVHKFYIIYLSFKNISEVEIFSWISEMFMNFLIILINSKKMLKYASSHIWKIMLTYVKIVHL